MENLFNIFEIILAVLLVGSILLQHRGTGLGGAFAGEGNVYRTRRGAERFLFISTIVLAVIFVIITLVNVLI
jgi:preprotein translocase subunit SecG